MNHVLRKTIKICELKVVKISVIFADLTCKENCYTCTVHVDVFCE